MRRVADGPSWIAATGFSFAKSLCISGICRKWANVSLKIADATASSRGNETIVHPPSLSPRGDDARPAKVGQVARDFRLAGPQDLHEIADANFLVGDEVEQAKPRAIGQRAKERVEREEVFPFCGMPAIIYGLTDMCKVSVWYNTYA